jgi:hypothetical protein
MNKMSEHYFALYYRGTPATLHCTNWHYLNVQQILGARNGTKIGSNSNPKTQEMGTHETGKNARDSSFGSKVEIT